MIDRRRFLGAMSLGLAAPSLALADSPEIAPTRGPLRPDEQVNRILGQARTDGRRLPGIVGAIVRGEEVAHVGAVGIRKAGSPAPIEVGDLMHIGSCTKAMTATMIGTLVDEGRLRWDSTIADIFKNRLGTIAPAYASVTLSQLLAHKGGFPHDVSWWQGGDGRAVVDQRRALLSKALQKPPEHNPGSKYAYSNVGYVLAGMMAEEVAGASWEDLMRRRLFKPLGMDSAGFGPPGVRGKVDHAWGHRASGDLVEAIHHDNAPSMGPAGTVHCSIADWARFASAHIRGDKGGVRLLRPETWKSLHTPTPGEGYAGGWFVVDRSWAGGAALNHNGSNTYWYSSIWLAPAKDLGFLVAANAGGQPAEEACDQAIKGLLRFASQVNNAPRR